MRLKLLIAAFLPILYLVPCYGQTTSVSGQITDQGAQAWANGTVTFTFRPSNSNPTGQYFQGGVPFNKNTTIGPLPLDNTGSFSAIAVPDNATITPSGSTFTTQVCPAATTPCFSQNLTITGATQNISSAVVPPAVVLNLSVPFLGARAYTDSEVTGALPGNLYFNLTDNRLHVCLQTGFPPCTWFVLNGGNVSSFSAGNANPFFTTFVTNPTSNPQLVFGVNTQNANCVFAGPTSGSPATPTCRPLVASDLSTTGAVELVLSTNLTPVTANTSTVSFQNLMASASPIASGALGTIGKAIRLTASGFFTPVNNTETVTVSFNLGSGGFPTFSTFKPTSAGGSGFWSASVTCTIKTTGAGGTALCSGVINFSDFVGVTGSFPVDTGASPLSINTTGTVTPQWAVAFNSASATNSMTQNTFTLEQLN